MIETGTLFCWNMYLRLSCSFLFLLQLSEDEAVDILARQFGVLLMHGAPFGAPNYLRLSYANLLPEEVSSAVDKVKRGLEHLQQLSKERCEV